MNIAVTIAVGERVWGDMALNWCLSVKANDEAQHTMLIYTSSAILGIEPLIEAHFDTKYRLPIDEINNPAELAFKTKIELYDLIKEVFVIPHAIVYMDADSIMLPGKKLSEWFDELKEVEFTAYCNDIYDFTTKKRNRKDYTFWCEPEVFKDCRYALLPQINSSFVFFKIGKKAELLFKCVRCSYVDSKLIEHIKYKNTIPDELCFNEGAAMTGILPHQIPYRPIFMQCFSKSFSIEDLFHQYRAFGFAGTNGRPKHLVNLYNEFTNYYRNYFGIIPRFKITLEPDGYKPIDIAPIEVKTLFRAGDVENSAGGIFNPSGAIMPDGANYTIYRTENDYDVLKGYKHNSASPYLVVDGVGRHLTTNFAEGTRVEDFRLFNHKNFLCCSHSIITKNLQDEMSCEVVISTIHENQLRCYPKVNLPITIQPIEKNWVFFVESEILYCVYSLSPYLIFKCYEGGMWEQVMIKQLEINWFHKHQYICNSTHPILVQGYYLMFFHTKENGIYYHGAVLLDKTTKEILYVTQNNIPITTGNGGMQPGLNYVSGACYVPDKQAVRVFIGEGDSHSVYNDFDATELINEIINNSHV